MRLKKRALKRLRPVCRLRVCAKLSLLQAAWLLDKAEGIAGNWTPGLLHLANALDKPVVPQGKFAMHLPRFAPSRLVLTAALAAAAAGAWAQSTDPVRVGLLNHLVRPRRRFGRGYP